MLVPPHFFVSTAFKKMRWKDEFRKWLPKLCIVSGLFLMFFWCPCMAINVNVQYNGGFLLDIILSVDPINVICIGEPV